MVLQPLLFALKGIPQVKYEKKLMILPVSLLFSQHCDIIWPKFCPKTTFDLIFLLVSSEGDSINTKKFNWNPVALKKMC